MEAPTSPEVPASKRTRRRYTRAFKSRVVEAATQGDRSVVEVALEHQLNANVVHKWIRLARSPAQAPAMLPVAVTAGPPEAATAAVIEIRTRTAVLTIRGEWNPARVAALVRALG